MSEPTNIFWYSSVAVQFFFCVHLLWTRLAKNHPIFTLYLGAAVLRSLVAIKYTVAANGALPLSYTYFWLWSEPVLLLLQIAVALEVHSGMWRDQTPPISQWRPMMVFALVMALAFAAIPVKAELSRFSTIHVQAVLQFEFLAKRYISTVLALFLIPSAVLFLVTRRGSLSSALLRHESMLAAYLSIYAVGYLVAEMGWTQTPLVNHYMLSALTLCCVVWISIFRPNAEPGR